MGTCPLAELGGERGPSKLPKNSFKIWVNLAPNWNFSYKLRVNLDYFALTETLAIKLE